MVARQQARAKEHALRTDPGPSTWSECWSTRPVPRLSALPRSFRLRMLRTFCWHLWMHYRILSPICLIVSAALAYMVARAGTDPTAFIPTVFTFIVGSQVFVLLFLVVAAVPIMRESWREAVIHYRTTTCTVCGYDLRMLSPMTDSRCPECGTPHANLSRRTRAIASTRR